MNCYVYRTRIGPFYIAKFPSNYHVIFDNQTIGTFDTAAQAAEELSFGQGSNIFEGAFRKLDISELRISPDLSKWERL